MALNATVIELTQPTVVGQKVYELPANFDPKAAIIFGTPQASADATATGWAYGIGFGTCRGTPGSDQVPNGNFETDVSGWASDAFVAATFVRDNTWSSLGSWSAKLDFNDATAGRNSGYRTPQGTSGIACTPGEILRVSAKVNAITPANGSFVRLYFYTSAGASLSNFTSPMFTGSGEKTIIFDVTVPATAAFYSVNVGGQSNGAYSAYWDDVRVFVAPPVQQRYCTMRSLDTATSADLASAQGNNGLYKIITNTAGSAAIDCEIDLIALQGGDNSAVVLDWVNLHTTASIRLFMMVLGGSDITDALAGVSSSYPTTGTDFDVTVDTGFGQPDMVMLASVLNADNGGSATLHPQFCLGWGFRTNAGVSFGYTQTDGNTASIVASSQRSSKIWQKIASGGASYEAVGALDLGSGWPTDGFRIVFDANPTATAVIPFLALKGSFNRNFGSGGAPTTGTPPVVVDHGAGFAPKIGFVMGWNLVAQTTIRTTDADLAAFGMGATDGTNEAWAGFTEDDAAGTMVSKVQRTNTKINRNYISSAGGGNLQSEADGSFSGNNLQLSWNDIDTVAREYYWFVLGDAPISSYDRTGALTAGTVLAGSDVTERIKTGVLLSTARGSGVDVDELGRAGALITTAQLVGADVSERAETGALIADTLLAGTSLKEAAAKPGSLIATGRLAGVDVQELSRLGSLLATVRLAGIDVSERSETGSLITDTLLAGVDVSERSETGSLLASVLLAGSDAEERARAGALVTDTLLAGTSLKDTPGKSGSLVTTARLVGVDVAEYTRLGALIATARLVGADVAERVETGLLSTTGLLRGVDVSERSETGALIADTTLTGADVAEFVEVGSLVSDTLLAGTDLSERGRAGTIMADTLLAGLAVEETAGVTGSLTAGVRLFGISNEVRARSGVILADTLLAGVSVKQLANIAQKSGVLVAATLIQGADVFNANRAGSLVTSPILSGFTLNEITKTGSLVTTPVLIHDIYAFINNRGRAVALVFRVSSAAEQSSIQRRDKGYGLVKRRENGY